MGFFLSIVTNLILTGLINIIFSSSTFMKRFVCPYSLGNGIYSNHNRDFAFRTIRKKIRCVVRSASPFLPSHGTEFERKGHLFFYFVILFGNEQLRSNSPIWITPIRSEFVSLSNTFHVIIDPSLCLRAGKYVFLSQQQHSTDNDGQLYSLHIANTISTRTTVLSSTSSII